MVALSKCSWSHVPRDRSPLSDFARTRGSHIKMPLRYHNRIVKEHSANRLPKLAKHSLYHSVFGLSTANAKSAKEFSSADFRANSGASELYRPSSAWQPSGKRPAAMAKSHVATCSGTRRCVAPGYTTCPLFAHNSPPNPNAYTAASALVSPLLADRVAGHTSQLDAPDRLDQGPPVEVLGGRQSEISDQQSARRRQVEVDDLRVALHVRL